MSKRPPLPTIAHFKDACRGVADHLMKTQKEGFGANLVNSMQFQPQRDIDTFQLFSARNDKHHHRNQIISTNNDLQPFSSTASPFGCFAGTVSGESCDTKGQIHTGVLATLADVESSIHLWGLAGPKSIHVSVGIDLNFTAPGKLTPPMEGERLLLLTRSPKIGKQLAFLEFSLYRFTKETLDEAKKQFLSAKDSQNVVAFLQNQESGVDDDESKGKLYEYFGLSSTKNKKKVIEDINFETSPLALQSFLFHQSGAPFATGWHEKAFIHPKEKK